MRVKWEVGVAVADRPEGVPFKRCARKAADWQDRERSATY